MLAPEPDAQSGFTRRSLSLDSLVTAISKLVVGLMNFVAAVVVAREFGPSGRGAVAVGLTLVLILMQFGNVGPPTLTSRPVTRWRSDRSSGTRSRGRRSSVVCWLARCCCSVPSPLRRSEMSALG